MNGERGREIRPARPPRRRAGTAAEPEVEGRDIAARIDRLEGVVVDGLAALGRRDPSPARIEEVVELLEAAIDHLVAIERRLDALEAAAPAPPRRRSATPRKAAATKKAGKPSAGSRAQEPDGGG